MPPPPLVMILLPLNEKAAADADGLIPASGQPDVRMRVGCDEPDATGARSSMD